MDERAIPSESTLGLGDFDRYKWLLPLRKRRCFRRPSSADLLATSAPKRLQSSNLNVILTVIHDSQLTSIHMMGWCLALIQPMYVAPSRTMRRFPVQKAQKLLSDEAVFDLHMAEGKSLHLPAGTKLLMMKREQWLRILGLRNSPTR
jgi:hypothetical protein